MSLDTLIAHSLLHEPPAPQAAPRTALVLMGGGARTAYQAGVLKALATLLRRAAGDTARPMNFPFQILVGTSAGALNATFLGSMAHHGLDALGELARFWRTLRSSHVYQLQTPAWARSSRVLAAWVLGQQVKRHRALLDNTPLVNTLHQTVDLPRLQANLEQGQLQAVAVTASSYTTGVHWTFCQTSPALHARAWSRPDRRGELQPLSIDHLVASAAIPFLFRAVPLWVQGHKEYFGDGSMRQTSPLSPAVHLGASRVLAIGVGQPQRASLVRSSEGDPSLGTIAGHAMASVFHDTLLADVEQAQRVSQTLASLPAAVVRALPYQPVRVLAIQPSQSMDELAQRHIRALPAPTRHLLEGLGALSSTASAASSAAALASYLLFEPPFVQALMDLGEYDAHARREELLAFLCDPSTNPPPERAS